MAAAKEHLAPPEFFDFPPVEISLSDEAEVKKLLERVIAIQLWVGPKMTVRVYRRTQRKKPKPKPKQ
jgi:hypothetical protein